MSDKIAEIRARHEAGPIGMLPMQALAKADDDRATLLAEVERLREALSWYADPSNHFPVEHRKPGDPSPAFVWIEEPPIMSDGGGRARKALEGSHE